MKAGEKNPYTGKWKTEMGSFASKKEYLPDSLEPDRHVFCYSADTE